MTVLRFGKYDNATGANSSMYFSLLMGYTSSQATFSATSIKGGFAPGDRAAILGSGFSFTNVSGPIRLAGGTVTSIALFEDNRSTLSITGINISGKAFGNKYLMGPTGLAEFITRGNDSLFGTALDDNLNAGAGKDTLFGGDGADYLFGAQGTDRLEGGDGDDTLSGNGATLDSDGNFIFGGNGNDWLQGSGGNDLLQGGAGNDSLINSGGADRAFGGSGNDLLDGEDGSDRLEGGAGNDTVLGSDGSDRLYAGTGSDILDGGNANDKLFAAAGNETMFGGDGNDLISGSSGSDSMSGGLGADRFVFDAALGASNLDQISDFEINIDKIVLDDDIFKALGSPGNLAVGKFRIGTDAADANDRIVYDYMTGNLYYDRDGNGSAAKVLFAVLASGLALDTGDFSIIA